MLAVDAASTLFIPAVGQWVDPRIIFGANLGHLAQHLLDTVGCYEFGVIALETGQRERWITYWRIVIGAVGIALVITYRLGRQYSIPAQEFTLGGAGARTHQWILLATLMTTFVGVLLSAVQSVSGDGFDTCLSRIFMGYLSITTIGCNAMVVMLMITNPAAVASHYHRITEWWSIPALTFLALAGIPGLASAWARRNDPRQ